MENIQEKSGTILLVRYAVKYRRIVKIVSWLGIRDKDRQVDKRSRIYLFTVEILATVVELWVTRLG